MIAAFKKHPIHKQMNCIPAETLGLLEWYEYKTDEQNVDTMQKHTEYLAT